jgi:type VI secretion system protein ImpM
VAAVISQRGARSDRPPGYYGKLPARADFVSRRLPRPTVEIWDNWLQACLARSQTTLGPAWQDRYLTAPAWRFALPAQACGDAVLIGVMIPSVDAIGRCFPLLIAQELPKTTDTAALAAEAAPWFEAAEAMALAALAETCDLTLLDRPLPSPVPAAHISASTDDDTAYPIGRWIELPILSALRAVLREAPQIGQRAALWWTGGGDGFRPGVAVTTRLIPPPGFAALLDGAWATHGWHGADDSASADTDLAWDRDS